MFFLRRTVSRALVAPAFGAAKPRAFSSATSSLFRLQQRQTFSIFQRRLYSDEVIKNAQESAESDTSSRTAAADDVLVQEESVTDSPHEAEVQNQQDVETQTAATGPSPNTLYLGNLYFEVNENQIKALLQSYGEIQSVKIIRDPRGMSRGFGFVEVAPGTDVQKIIEDLHQQSFQGRRLVCQLNTPNPRSIRRAQTTYSPNTPSKTLFIGNMSFEMSDKDLNELFKDIKNVLDVRVAIDRRSGQPRGFAHADFIDVPSAEAAHQVLQGMECYGRTLRVDYSHRGDRRRPGQEDA